MAQYPSRLASVELTTASVDQVTAGTNQRIRISHASVANKTATARYVTVTVTPSGGSAFNVVYRVVVPSSASPQQFPLYALTNLCLNPGDKISALAEANSALDLVISGIVSE
jgi:hypothetical protein